MRDFKSACNQLKLSKRGVYAITSEGTLRSFRLIPWEEILNTLKTQDARLQEKPVQPGPGSV